MHASVSFKPLDILRLNHSARTVNTIRPISVADASALLAADIPDYGIERVALGAELMGRTLQEALCADRDFPPFNRATMDGYAVNTSALASAHGATLPVQGRLAAGAVSKEPFDPSGALRINTGAAVPDGADAVVAHEQTESLPDHRIRLTAVLHPGDNIHRRASDAACGETLVKAGSQIDANVLAVAATVGAATLAVNRLPRIAVITTGQELVPVEASPDLHQIRASNGILITTLLRGQGLSARETHLSDDPGKLTTAVSEAIADSDILITTGGISMGDHDHLARIFSELGVDCRFHRIAQKPGKPMWYGQHPDGCRVFGLPGNPVSTYLCMVRHVLPVIQGLRQVSPQPTHAVLRSTIENKLPLTRFFPVRTVSCPETGRLLAEAQSINTSGDFLSTLGCSGFVEIPPQSTVAEGSLLRIHTV
jgi:molybdopterin molybdotransferase